ncbi:hypothetical protein AB4851_17570 [Burkholderia sp. 22PA0099]|uniref:hypothetical protein n=1 Tax=Burkholderia sp. 22PA0099 TaxID=3237372 RepID=UPI0039C0B3CB
MSWPIPVFVPVKLPEPVSLRVWLPALVAIASSAAGAVLLLWPHGKPTQAIQFWILLIGAPLVACGFVLGWRLNRWETDQLVADETEREQTRLMSLWKQWCRRRVKIARAVAFLPIDETVASLADPNVDLPVNAQRSAGLSWLEKGEARRACFLSLVAECFADALRGRREMTLTLMLADVLPEQFEGWATSTHSVFTRAIPDVAFKVEVRPVVGCDTWLTQQVDCLYNLPQLIIAAQLWPGDETTLDFSEGAAALLIDPDASQPNHVFRSMTTAAATLDAGLAQLVQMQVAPDRITHGWLTGCTDESAAITVALTTDPKKPLIERSLDHIVGRPGPISSWIVLATALEASQAGGAHLVAWREPEDESLHLCMVTHAEPQASRKEY